MAEGLGRGLQILLRRFDSVRRLLKARFGGLFFYPLSKKKIKVHIAGSREGVFFILFLLGLGAAVVYTSKNSLILLFCFLLFTVLATLVLGRRNVLGLSLSRRINHELFAAQEAHIDILTRNDSARAHYSLHVYEDFEQRRTIGPIFIPTLAPGEVAQAPYDCVFPYRGNVRFRQIQVRSRFPIPFFEFRATYPCDEQNTVYPQRLPQRDLVTFAGNSDETRGNARRRQNRIQALQDGRQAGRILWKISAKRGTLIEEVAKPARAATSHVVQLTPKYALTPLEFERQISQITDFCLDSLDKGDAVSIRYGDQLTSGKRRDLLEFLSHV